MPQVHRRRRSVAARIRKALAAALTDQPGDATTTAAVPAETEPVTEAAPEPPRREHLFGSQYTVRMTFDELMATRGYTGEQVLQRRRLVAPGDGQRQRDAATRRAGYVPGEVLWPSE